MDGDNEIFPASALRPLFDVGFVRAGAAFPDNALSLGPFLIFDGLNRAPSLQMRPQFKRRHLRIMTPELFEKLLFRSEGDSLDFKVDHYAFDTAEEKAEVLKDILALANSWRNSDAYILIGVQEGKHGKPAIVHGITKTSFDDNNLQQFLKPKLNRRLSVQYEEIEIKGLPCAVISIPLQERPFYASKDFGKVKAETVYVRRGSATITASPDEIVSMRGEAIQSAAFAIVAQIDSGGSPGQYRYISVSLINVGTKTADDVTVHIDSISKELIRSSAAEGWTTDGSVFSCPSPIHPTAKHDIGLWNVRPGPDRLAPGESMWGYNWPDADLRITIYARDLPPVRVAVHFDGIEIRNNPERYERTFKAIR